MKIFKSLFCNHLTHELMFLRNLHGDEINQCNARSLWICTNCGRLVYRNIYYDKGNISDGYHTFNELYHHRAILTATLFNCYKERCWKSRKHHDGTMYHNMFIVGIDTPEGQATYHYDIDLYWNIFNVKELANAPEWDGHTSDQAIDRIKSLIKIENKPKTIQKTVVKKPVKKSFFTSLKKSKK